MRYVRGVTALALDGLEAQLPVLAADELERERAAVAVAGASSR